MDSTVFYVSCTLVIHAVCYKQCMVLLQESEREREEERRREGEREKCLKFVLWGRQASQDFQKWPHRPGSMTQCSDRVA